MMRVGLFKNVHVKTLTSQKRRALLTARALLQEKAIALENDMRGLLRNFGLKVGVVSAGTFEERVRELVAADADLREIMEPLLAGRRKLRAEFAKLDKKVVQEAQPVPQFAVGGSRSRTHDRSQPVRRKQKDRPYLSMRRRDDAVTFV
ncbi:hypothetical protein BLJAPNOD_06745 [Ensifer sp. M14]|nr:hypothetical protein BLJAPNOD_06745 [Ensifer sp. M14]